MFDRLEFGTNPFQTVTSEEKLDEVLAWLLRLKSFRQYAEKDHHQQRVYGLGFILQKSAV